MINITKFFIFILFLSSCSLSDVGGFWSKQKELKNQKLKFETLFKKDDVRSKEFNQNIEFVLDNKIFKLNYSSKIDNNDGYTLFNGELNKIQKYNFKSIKNFHILEPNLIFYNNNLIFFDNNGHILSFNDSSKLNWKVNNYSKSDKKVGLLISMNHIKNQLFVSDNLSNIYSLDINNGKLLWLTKNESPFNSEIKFFKDKIFAVDSNNSLNCFSMKDGSLIWQYKTEKSFINSSKKLSIIVKDKIVIFSNSLGDITALNVDNGSLLWQKFTHNSKIYEDIMTLKTSNLIENDNSLYFSNNKNQFYSLDLYTGNTNWIQNINTNIKPSIIGNYIFTISLDGYFFIIEKGTGNILRITSLFDHLKKKKNEKIYPTGFIFNSQDIFISTTNGKLLVVNIKTGNIKNILKVDNDTISRPFSQNQNMYLIKDNSIIKLN